MKKSSSFGFSSSSSRTTRPTHTTTCSNSLVRTGEFERNQRSSIEISDGIQLVYEYHSEIGEFWILVFHDGDLVPYLFHSLENIDATCFHRRPCNLGVSTGTWLYVANSTEIAGSAWESQRFGMIPQKETPLQICQRLHLSLVWFHTKKQGTLVFS